MYKTTEREQETCPGPEDSGAGRVPAVQDSGYDATAGGMGQYQSGISGRHVRPVVLEAMEILQAEGWLVGRIANPAIPFDVVGILDKATILLKVVRAKCPISNAKETARAYYDDIRRMQPFWNHDADNLQFWVISKVTGLLRYRVYRGGIWNEATRTAPEQEEPLLVPSISGCAPQQGPLCQPGP